jgi:hypothetical protein
VSKLLRNFDRKNRRNHVEGLCHMGPKFLWKEVTLLSVGWFLGPLWNDNEKGYMEPLEVLCTFYGIYVIYKVTTDRIIQPGQPRVGGPLSRAW